MSPSTSRARRVPLERYGPIRNPVVPRANGADGTPRATRPARTASGADLGAAVAGTARAAERIAEVSNAAVRGAVECGVQTAYTVIDEYMRRGREAASRQPNRPDGSGDMNDRQYDSNWSAAWGPMWPMVAPWMQVMKVWTDAVATNVPGAGPQDGWNPGTPGPAPPNTASAAPFAAATRAPKVSVKVSSQSPIEVTPVVWRFDAGMQLVADPLQNSDSSLALPLNGVAITCGPGTVQVSVTVVTDQPAGRYSGAIWTAGRSEVVGSLTVEIAGPAGPSA